MTQTPAAYLAALPPNVQEQLVALTKLAADSDTSEKETMLLWIENGATNLLQNALWEEHMKLGGILTTVGQLLCALDRAARPQEVN
ncbi:hypothetical protein [Pimelobacter simplex]|uniref:hypothetical protein n=1 Tax=Nocardioides simplex TaxID=2045 RepID=UPI001934279C|nr:hypothetical protein [Pimelobacter simplex]